MKLTATMLLIGTIITVGYFIACEIAEYIRRRK
jgi:hypothetical protein